MASTHGARWIPDYGWVYVGTSLPNGLRHYLPRRYSWQQWLAEDLTGPTDGDPTADGTTGTITLRADQIEDTNALLTAQAAGAPEFLLGSKVGTGKTMVAIAAAKRMPGVRRILVVCPLTVAPGWRTALDQMGDGGKRWCIINYESSKRLLAQPASAAQAKRRSTKNRRHATDGIPRVAWDLVITDESHMLADPASQRSKVLERVIAGPKGTGPAFSLRMSATAGRDPSKLAYLHRGLAWRSGEPVRTHITAEQYQTWCAERGIVVQPGRFGNKLYWPEKNDADLDKMNLLLFTGAPKWGIRREPEWPDQQRHLLPVELTTDEQDAYEEEWSQFEAALKEVDRLRKAVRRSGGKGHGKKVASARAKGLAAMTRYRQKAGQLRAPYSADFALDLVEKGYQVAISCEYLGTVDRVREHLHNRDIEPALFTGDNRDTREDDRLRFQRGETPIILFTPAEGFNLQAGEAASGATTAPRATVVAEPRWSPIKALQVEGRAHRNGYEAPCYYAYATDTIEEKVLRTVLDGMQATSRIMGDDTDDLSGLAAVFGVEADSMPLAAA